MAFYANELRIRLPSYGVELYPAIHVRDAIARAASTGEWIPVVSDECLAQARRSGAWNDVAAATAFGDVLAFGISDHGHVGVVTGHLLMLHVSEGMATRGEQRYDAPTWAPVLTGIYRWASSS